MPKYEPSPLDESRTRYDRAAKDAARVANRKILIGVVALAVAALVVIVVLLVV